MDTYKLMVVHWSIFTLSLQLIYCASVYTTIDTNHQSLCSDDTDILLPDEGQESSLTFELNPGMSHSSCRRTVSTKESYGFYMSLVRPMPKKNHASSKNIGFNTKQRNATGSCPISIYSASDPLVPSWKIDPCELEEHGAAKKMVRLMQPGKLKVVWFHNGNKPSHKLIVTVLGKGAQCQREDKHPCLTFGEETLLCISDALTCDGVRHCPEGNDNDSDEDPEMCSKRHLFEKDLALTFWQKLSREVYQNLFPAHKPAVDTKTELTDMEKELMRPTHDVDSINNSINERDVKRKRGTLTRGLSRYGPWGFLMLGMLLCGGALLICGLWECCCRRTKPVNSLESGDNSSANGSDTTSSSPVSTSTPSSIEQSPPNYDEIDPPPSYSVLFPNQKSFNDIVEDEGQSQDAVISVTTTTTTTTTDAVTLPTLNAST